MEREPSRRVSAVWGVALLVVLFAGSGCATSSGQQETAAGEENERDVPPEVSDSTVEDRTDRSRSLQARVEVEFDAREFPAEIDIDAYESTVRKRAQRCYNRRVYGGGLESGGTMVYEVLVTRNGHVAGTDRMSTDLRDEELESCLEHVLGRLRFEIASPDKPVYRLSVRFSFELDVLVPSESPV